MTLVPLTVGIMTLLGARDIALNTFLRCSCSCVSRKNRLIHLPPPPPSCLTLSQIARATNLLNVMEPRELTSIYENQAAKMLLNKEASLISQLSHEGMMTPHDSETELKRINADLNSIEKLRKAHSKYVRRLVSLTSLL
jgi:hypothetical protein